MRAFARRWEIRLPMINSSIADRVVIFNFAGEASVHYNFVFEVGRPRVRRGRGHGQIRTIADEFKWANRGHEIMSCMNRSGL